MKKRKFSSLTPQDRFLFNVTIVVIIAAILVFAIFMGILIQERIQTSDNDSKQPSNPITAPLNDKNDENSLNASPTSNAWNDGSTNGTAPSTEPIISNTNSN